MNELECVLCGSTTSSFFIAVGNKAICTACKMANKPKPGGPYQKPRVFTRYICDTHNVGTYSVNNMFFRHLMKDCKIRTQRTLGVVRPATYGGINGDIGRDGFLGVNEMDRLKTNLNNYIKFVGIYSKIGYSKITYTSRKYYNKHTGFLWKASRPNFHKYDEVFKKLKFNYNVYVRGQQKNFPNMLTREERKNLYYKDLMKKFEIQVKSK